jgi:hypothetical protein
MPEQIRSFTVNKAVYIGIYSEGSTSKMRGERLRSLLPGWKFDVIDTDVPFSKQTSISRSLGFRYKIGPVIGAVNNYIRAHLVDDYNLIWVDKGVYITNETTTYIRAKTEKLVHYTPDTAFFGNKSKMFYQSIDYYDYLVTTKSFELKNYGSLVSEQKIILTTQGFDSEIHKPVVSFEQKLNQVAFVGQCENSREEVLQFLLDHNIHVVLSGFKWEKFVKKNRGNPFLDYRGKSVYSANYTSLISESYFSLGLLSKLFPERHTTRTFEIPACGTALITEKNEETSSFFSDDEAIFYKDQESLLAKIRYFQQHPDELRILTSKGLYRVNAGEFDYCSILKKTLIKIFPSGYKSEI